jgi:hypothetical protein
MKWIGFAAVGLAIGVGLAFWFLPAWSPQQRLARLWEAEISQFPPTELLPRMRELVKLDSTRWRVLVRSLASPRPAESAAARTVLREQVTQWKLLSHAESSRRVSELAESLAEIFDQADARNREFAAEMAGRILDWPVEQSPLATARMLRSCELILRQVRVGRKVQWAGTPSRLRGRDPLGNDNAADSTEPAADVLDAADAAPPSLDSSQIPEVPVTQVSPIDDSAISNRVPRLAATSGSRRSASISDSPDAPPVPSLDGTQDEEADGAAAISELPTRELINYVRHDDLIASSGAIRELRRRGFDEREFDLTLQLTDPDPAVRRRLVERLPDIADFDPAPWLIWLSRDNSASVRQAATALMATSADPRLRNRLRAMELEDDDADVVRTARQAR